LCAEFQIRPKFQKALAKISSKRNFFVDHCGERTGGGYLQHETARMRVEREERGRRESTGWLAGWLSY
jgi:hypothetical protein